MNEPERWDYLMKLDEEFLVGGAILSEWCSAIVREADTAFAHGAHLASILTAVSGIETYMRSETGGSRNRLVALIDEAPIPENLRSRLHELRRYRNKWVHVDDPWDDSVLLDNPEALEVELEQKAQFAARVLRETIYSNQWL
jgi:hypothetical protein